MSPISEALAMIAQYRDQHGVVVIDTAQKPAPL